MYSVVKLYAWEISMELRVQQARKLELRALFNYIESNRRLLELMFAAQPTVAMVLFTTTIFVLKRQITLVTVFRCLAFINILRFPMNLLGQALKNISNAKVSLRRLTNFFRKETLNPSMLKRGDFDTPTTHNGDTTQSKIQ